MSKFLLMGMPLNEVIKASTWAPAQVIRHEELGHLSVGAVADVAILIFARATLVSMIKQVTRCRENKSSNAK